MTEAWPYKPYTFRALCRRDAPLRIGGLQEVEYRSKTFSC
jgi:hypothetical protein